MKLLPAAAVALGLAFGPATDASAQFSRKDYPRDRERVTASAKTTERTETRAAERTRERGAATLSSRSRTSDRPATRPRTEPPRERAATWSRKTPNPTTASAPQRTERRRETTRPRATTVPRAPTPATCPPPSRPRRTTYEAPRRPTTRVVYRDYGTPDRAGYGNVLSRRERRAYQRELTRRAERLGNWEAELVQRAARRNGRDPYLSPRDRRELTARYFPYSTAGVLFERELRDWDAFLDAEAGYLSAREERLRRANRRARPGRRRGQATCPPGGW